MGNLDLFRPPQEMKELRLLQELEKNPITSQRELSNKFGIALGVTNACLKRMARRGWIRIMSLNQRKISYCLTPKGLAEKAKLTLHLISWTVQHYSTLKEIIERIFLEMQRHGIKRIVFYGVSDEMEIAYISLQGVDLELVGIIDDDINAGKRKKEVFGFELKDISQIDSVKPDAVLITSLSGQDERAERLRKYIDAQGIQMYTITNP
jgi:DNA-binding MarR family transcriptional regulator